VGPRKGVEKTEIINGISSREIMKVHRIAGSYMGSDYL